MFEIFLIVLGAGFCASFPAFVVWWQARRSSVERRIVEALNRNDEHWHFEDDIVKRVREVAMARGGPRWLTVLEVELSIYKLEHEGSLEPHSVHTNEAGKGSSTKYFWRIRRTA